MMDRKNSQVPSIPISTTKRPELDLLDPVSPTSLKAAKPPSEGHHVDVGATYSRTLHILCITQSAPFKFMGENLV